MINLKDDSVIVDKDLFYCCSGSMKVEHLVQKNIFSEFIGVKKLSQTKISGTGVVVLTLPVLQNELQEIFLSSPFTAFNQFNFFNPFNDSLQPLLHHLNHLRLPAFKITCENVFSCFSHQP